jgi:hypothetical protein
MAAPDDTKIQGNFKWEKDGTLINIYASSAEEFESLLTTVQDTATLIYSVEQTLKGLARLNGQAVSQTPSAPLNPLDDRANPPASSANSCKHGAMKYREGVGDKGPWKGYFCQAPKGALDKCKNVYVK